MILQSLHEYYGRKRDSLPCDGIERKELPFLFVLKSDGTFLHIEDTRQGDGKRKRGNAFLVPQGVKKSVNVAANLLWGNVEYVIGQPDPKKLEEQRKKGKEKHYQERLRDMHSAFRTAIEQLPSPAKSTPEVAAVLAFLSSGNFTTVLADPLWPQVSAAGANVSFKLTGEESPVCSASGILASVGQSSEGKGEPRICLVTGNPDIVERLHPPIKGVWGAQTSGANIVSFNLSAFNSFAREQGSNAPIGKRAAFAYTTALNHLLASKQRIQVGDASTAFWAAADSRMESLLSIDEGVAEIVKALRDTGELENTLVIYTSDNGFFHGEHRIPNGKNRVYEEAVKVPLLMRGPGIDPGITVDELTINTDIAATIADYASADPLVRVDGRSLVKLMDEPQHLFGREVLIEQFSSIGEDGEPEGIQYSAVRTQRYKYVENATGELELYDLELDPYELDNQKDNPAYDKIQLALAKRLDVLRDCAGSSCREKPRIELKIKGEKKAKRNDKGKTIGFKSCFKAGSLSAKVKRRNGETQIVEVTFRVEGKKTGVRTAKPFERKLRPSLLKSEKRPEVSATAMMLDGRGLTLVDDIKVCQ